MPRSDPEVVAAVMIALLLILWIVARWPWRHCAACGHPGRIRPRGRYWTYEDGLTRGRDRRWYCRDPHDCYDRERTWPSRT